MRAVIAYLRRDLWSPYVAGALLGLVAILTLWSTTRLDNMPARMPGASGSFQNLAAYLGQELTGTQKAVAEGGAPITVPRKGLEEPFIYFAFTMPKGITWQVWMIVGIFLGALVSSLLSGGFRLSVMPHTDQWQTVFGPQPWKRWVLVFIGGIILQIAAGIAGGCTSGLAISGGVQLTPAAFLFIAGMFISGIATALVVYRRRF